MSEGFAGSTTKSMSEKFDEKVQKRMDTFTDDFKKDGAKDAVPGQNVSRTQDSQDKHTDNMSAADIQEQHEQHAQDSADDIVQKEEAVIKGYSEQFAGLAKMKTLSTNDHELASKEIEKRMSGYGLHVVKFPSGRYGYAGSVPRDLVVTHADGSPLSNAEFTDYKQSSNPAMTKKAKGYKEPVFSTAQEAVDFAKKHGHAASVSER